MMDYDWFHKNILQNIKVYNQHLFWIVSKILGKISEREFFLKAIGWPIDNLHIDQAAWMQKLYLYVTIWKYLEITNFSRGCLKRKPFGRDSLEVT